MWCCKSMKCSQSELLRFHKEPGRVLKVVIQRETECIGILIFPREDSLINNTLKFKALYSIYLTTALFKKLLYYYFKDKVLRPIHHSLQPTPKMIHGGTEIRTRLPTAKVNPLPTGSQQHLPYQLLLINFLCMLYQSIYDHQLNCKVTTRHYCSKLLPPTGQREYCHYCGKQPHVLF